jgi:DNA-binding CsgD family transcriptional regulator
LTQSEVARRLRISRQAVSKAKKSLEGILQARQLDAELSPRTGESLALTGPDGDLLRAKISTMVKESKSISEIARMLRRFRHSIQFIVDESGT